MLDSVLFTSSLSVGVVEGPAAADQAKAWGLHPSLQAAVASAGLTRFFPIQAAVIPEVLRAERTGDKTFGDVCISAPTGSGKTLAYALPIIQVRAFASSHLALSPTASPHLLGCMCSVY